jgi:hypothetical protein
MSKIITFNATLDGQAVRLTVRAQDLDIVTRDNAHDFDAQEYAHKLTEIQLEDIYEE